MSRGSEVRRTVELRRHTDADGDVLSDDGIRAALEIGGRLGAGYDVMVSSGAQRATQTIACLLAAGGRARLGVAVDARFRGEDEDRWRQAYERAGAGDLESFLSVDAELVESAARVLGAALRAIFDRLPGSGRALVVGHSPMQEAAVYGLTGEVVEPLAKGAGVAVVEDGGGYRVEALD